MIEQMKDPVDQAKLVDEVKELVKKAYPDEIKNLDLNDDHIKKVLDWSLNRIVNLNQLVEEKFSFLWILPGKSKHNLSKGKNGVFVCDFLSLIHSGADTLEKLVKTLTSVENFEKQDLNSILKNFSLNENVKFTELMQSIRMILSGLKVISFVSYVRDK